MDDLELAYLITGTDRPKIETAIRRLRRHFDASSVETVAAPETPAADVVAVCNAGSLFGDRRLVVVDEVDGRANAEGRLGGGWKAADVEVMATYLADPSPTTVVALVARDLKPDSALGKAAARAGTVLEYGFAPRKLVPWVAERFRQHGVKADGDACQALIELVGDDPYGLATEIDKLATWAGGEPVSSSDVAALVAATADPPIFELTDAWARRDAAAVLEVSEAIFGREAKARRDIAPRLAAGVASHVVKVKTAKRLAAAGVLPKDALGELGTRSAFYAGKLFSQAEAFSDEELRDATVRLAALDLGLKGQGVVPPDLELQLALRAVSAPDAR